MKQAKCSYNNSKMNGDNNNNKINNDNSFLHSNITLIGMPASGKSTVGVILAKILGMNFVDSDLVIQEQEGKLLSEIIAEVGPDGFLEVEDRINSCIQAERSIIATGGSAVYGENAMRHLKEISTVVYLKVDFPQLRRRLGNIKQRGVVVKDGQTLEDIYNERSILYEKYADIVIEEKGTLEDVLEEIRSRIAPHK